MLYRTRVPIIFVALVALFTVAPCLAAGPRMVDTLFQTDDIVIATQIVNPTQGDATTVIQSAIDQVASGGGGVVFLPAGRYRLDGRLVMKKGVTLRGDWAPPTTNGWQRGTILMPTADRGNADGTPAITLMSNSGVRNVTFWYPGQNPRRPVAYPWTIGISQVQESLPANAAQTVLNVTLINSYKGVSIGPAFNFLHVLRNIYGTPLKMGLSIDTCYDIGRTQNVDFRPDWWEGSGFPGSPSTKVGRAALRGFLMREGLALDLGRDEWGYLYDVRVKGYRTGMFIRQGDGMMNGVMYGCQVLDCGTAICFNVASDLGIGITGCRFSGRQYAIYAPGSFAGVVQFNSCSFESSGRNAIRSEGDGTMTFRNCDFRSWKSAGIDTESGTLSVMSCKFTQSGPHVVLGKKAKRAIILSNSFVGSPSIKNSAEKIDLQVSHRQIESARPDVSLLPLAPDYKPATRRLFVVTDFGASSAADDNTYAFAKALDEAHRAGGGTVYVPAGAYRFSGSIVVPSGVELRGSFDIAHHTSCAGSALLPTAGRGNANGTPFIRLKRNSGLRGLTIWYPDQDPANVVEYPWAVQGLGPQCWVVNLNCGNAYQGVDFWTYPSDGHVIKYLSGAYFRKGLFISRSKGDGWVDDLHYNPHYSAWVDPVLKPRTLPDWTPIMNYVRMHLDGIVFGHCEREYVKGTFLYAAHDGMAFLDDGGGSNARVIHHGTDTGSRCVAVEASGKGGIDFINTQATPLAPDVKGGLVVDDAFTGKARFFNTMLWAEAPAGVIGGRGDVLIQQLCNRSGTLTLSGGRCMVENAINNVDWNPPIRVSAGCKSARLVGNIAASGIYHIENAIGERCLALANSLSIAPSKFVGIPNLRTGWEDGDSLGALQSGTTQPTWGEGVSGVSCSLVTEGAHSGTKAVRIAGSSDDPKHGYTYFTLFNGPIAVYPDTMLSYWIKPMNDRSRSSGIDLIFTDGSNLRASGLTGLTGEGAHPANTKGTVGEWKLISIPIGKHLLGKTIQSVIFAYDGLPGTGPFETLFDDLRIESTMWNMPWKATASPAAGVYNGSVRVELKSSGNPVIRYTLDGTDPKPNSRIYTGPIVLDHPGLWDVRYALQSPSGRLSSLAFGQLYEVKPVSRGGN